MLVELRGKGGRVCEHARLGEIRCPLIVRPTSEDQITGQMFQVLRAINPRWWLPQLLNTALQSNRFRQRAYRKLTVDLWVNQPRYPAEWLPWSEGSTQVDVVIRWENPPTTVFVEMKYTSPLSSSTSNGGSQIQFPSDQLIRNVRVGLWRAGWFEQRQLFLQQPRDFVTLVIGANGGSELVKEYRSVATLRASIPFSQRLRGLPIAPFIGELGYDDIIGILKKGRRWLTRAERMMVDDLAEYLQFKLGQIGAGTVRLQQLKPPCFSTDPL